MTAHARVPVSRLRGRRASLPVRAAFATIALAASSAASAEVGATVSVFNDLRFRSYSLSARHPVAIVDLSYDDPSGVYAAISASAVARGGGPKPLGLQLNAGYAKQVAPDLTLDVGVIRSDYSHYSGNGESISYTEIYAGVARKWLSSRIYYSPHYFENGTSTLYGELNASVSPARKWRIEGHIGMLVPVSYRPDALITRTSHDWSIGVAREVGPLSLHATLSGGGPGKDYYNYEPHSRTAVVFGASWVL